MKNTYSRTWFELFLQTRSYTKQEIAFVERNLPDPPFHHVLDLCCGEGRLTNLLAEKDYKMMGVDLDAEALSIAAHHSKGVVQYLELDMRHVHEVPGMFDAVILIWQSFGYFNEAGNRDIIRQISEKLRPGGRFILDIYNKAYWLNNQGEREFSRKEVKVHSEVTIIDGRLRSVLSYGGGLGMDVFEWQLYSLDEIQELAKAFGLELLLSCTECDEGKPVSAEKPMMQIVFEKKS
ncbi:MAG TPA: class I SAM-dependent methyltransferase [Anaerolineales bacterium]|nr:class I SAM-dependent methyltransferase [Anaerolineales bacterium]